MLLALVLSAAADTITLDTGAVIEGDLARYEFGGDCQVSVTEGQLSGVILIVPCHRVESFMRTTVRTPVAIGSVKAEKSVTAAVAAAPVVERPEAATVPVEPVAEALAPIAGPIPVLDRVMDAVEAEAVPETTTDAPEMTTAPLATTPEVSEGQPRQAGEMGAIDAEAPVETRRAVQF